MILWEAWRQTDVLWILLLLFVTQNVNCVAKTAQLEGKREGEVNSKRRINEIPESNFDNLNGDNKRAAFSPWGGKRSDQDLAQELIKRATNILEEEIQKKNFQPWGGKRSFQPWGGKRSFQPWGGKRAFQPWGGKRASKSMDSKKTFQPWGGKRAFQPWGGKRYADLLKKNSFQPWGGKRAALTEEEILEMMNKKSQFQPWGGKRSVSLFRDTGDLKEGHYKRWGDEVLTSQHQLDKPDKKKFQPWGGKRQPIQVSEIKGTGKTMVIPISKKEFQSWGGKRSLEITADAGIPSSLNTIIEDASTVSHPRHKRNYQSWNSKRPLLDKSQTGLPNKEVTLYDLPALVTDVDDEISETVSKRQFAKYGGRAVAGVIWPWHSKREFNPWGGKREFNPWGGKRSTNNAFSLERLRSLRNVLRSVPRWKNSKRPEFNPWGGKR